MDNKELRNMPLHALKNIYCKCGECIDVIRVEGGWIYKTAISNQSHDNEQLSVSTCFVPEKITSNN